MGKPKPNLRSSPRRGALQNRGAGELVLRGIVPWWCPVGRVHVAQIRAAAADDDCAKDTFLAAYGYTETEACEADNVANYLGDSKGTCPGDPKGEDCYYDSNLFAYGSTQVAQCPGELDPFRRRKLTRSGTHSGAMKTKGVFTLTASGSK